MAFALPPPKEATAAGVADFDPRFPLVAEITFTDDCDPSCSDGAPLTTGQAANILTFDNKRRRIYAYRPTDSNFPRGIAVVDADRLRQTAWIDLSNSGDASLPSNAFSAIAFDEGRGRMFLGETTSDTGCPQLNTCRRIAVVDVTERSSPEVVNLPRAGLGSLGGSQTPPELSELDVIRSLAYDQVRDRLYILTSGGNIFDSNGGFDPKGVSIVAYDAASLSPTSQPLWTYRPRACPTVLKQRGANEQELPYFDVANDGSFVYFACRGVPAAVGATTTQHGVVRVNLVEGSDPDPTAAFTTEFFPLAGNLAAGFATGDPAGDRLGIAIAGGGAQRLYVFDARHGAWVGSMILGDANTGGAGADPRTGRMYVFAEDLGLRFIDAAALPPIILETPITIGRNLNKLPALTVDPLTRRVLMPGQSLTPHLWVYEDRTAPYVPAPPEDPDTETNDIDEDSAVQVSHTAFGSAYGARAIIVRGVGGVPFVHNVNTGLANFDATEPYTLESGDRGLFLSQVAQAELSGEREHGSASASAVAGRMDEATEADLRGKYGHLANQLGLGGDAAGSCDQSAPASECLSFDSVTGNVAPLRESTCKDFGNAGEAREGAEPGSAVACRRLAMVTAWASISANESVKNMSEVAFKVAESEARTELVKDPTGGIQTVSTAVARGVSLSVPGAGRLSIGEIQSTAISRAEGRPNAFECPVVAEGCTKSTLDSIAKNVRIVAEDGDTLFACGIPGVSSEDDQCRPDDISRGINKHLAPRVQARGPRQGLDPNVVNSPGGARAVVVKDAYAFWNDATINGDTQNEVTALELTLYNDTSEPSRLVLQLAGVYSEAQYQIGAPKAPGSVDPTRLSIGLIDEEGEALDGGVFQVRESDSLGLPGQLVAACVTGDDGGGDCEFEGLPAGEYVISETAAPAGYAPSDDATISLFDGLHTQVVFTNLRAVGRIDVSVKDDGGQTGTPAPLPGATFAVLADNGDLVRGQGDQFYGECTTDATGACTFEDVPLGAYVVYQKAAPDGYLVADDVGFVLELPGQAAQLSFVTGLEGTEGRLGGGGDGDAAADEKDDLARDTAFVEEPTETTTVIIEEPPMRPAAQVSTSPLDRPSGLRRVIGLPGEAAGFLRRQPLQAALFGLVWLLLGAPVYLAVRRRTLTIAKEVV